MHKGKTTIKSLLLPFYLLLKGQYILGPYEAKVKGLSDKRGTQILSSQMTFFAIELFESLL